MEQEIWKPITGYEGLYSVSNLGRVKSLSYKCTGVEKILKPGKYGGYLRVGLCKNGKCKFFLVHRLVAIAFIPNPMGLPEVNHLNEDKTLNVVSNLEWASRSYNINFGSRNEKVAAAFSKAIEASRFSDFREIELRFSSTQEAKRNGYSQGNVAACCNGCYCSKGNFYKNLYWRYSGRI